MHNVIIIVKDSFESGSNSALSLLMLSSLCIINPSATDQLFQYYPPRKGCAALSSLHAFTGCDTIWKCRQNSYPEAEAFLHLILERFTACDLIPYRSASKRSFLGIILQENSGYTSPTYWTTSQQNIQIRDICVLSG